MKKGNIKEVVQLAIERAKEKDEAGCFCPHSVLAEAWDIMPTITLAQVSGAMHPMRIKKELITLSMKSICKHLDKAHDFYRLETPASHIHTAAPKLDVTEYNTVITMLEAEIAKLETKKAGLESAIKILKDLKA